MFNSIRHSIGHFRVQSLVPLFKASLLAKPFLCVRDTKNVSDFVQKHFVSATNFSQFAQPEKQHCVWNNVSSFTRAFKKSPLCLCLKRVYLRNHSYENDFDLYENATARRTQFHMKGFALRLVLKQRHKRTRKWPILIYILQK